MENEKVLTNSDLISYLLINNIGEDMKGMIRPKGKCSICQGAFVEIKKLGFICPEHKIVPKRFLIDLFYKGQRIRLFSDKQGQPLDTYQRALSLLTHINFELKNHIFDPLNYIKQELEKFYVTNLLDKFLDFKINKIAPSYKSDLKRHVRIAKNYFGAKDVREIKKLDIVNYKDYLEKNFNYRGKTVKNVLDVFKTFLRYLKSDLEIVENVPIFPVIEVKEPTTIWLSPEVQKRVLEVIPEEGKPIVIFLMLTGCRPGEARALKCKDVDLEKRIIKISATFSGGIYREKRKGKKAKNAIIPIHQELYPYIKNRVEENLPDAYVFTNPKTSKYFSKSKLEKLWASIREKVGLTKDVRLYDATRHSFASQLVNKGVSLLSVSRLLGHSSVKMTERYAHSDIEKLRVDVNSLSLSDDKIYDINVTKVSLK